MTTAALQANLPVDDDEPVRGAATAVRKVIHVDMARSTPLLLLYPLAVIPIATKTPIIAVRTRHQRIGRDTFLSPSYYTSANA